jgi:SAP domain-containing new25
MASIESRINAFIAEHELDADIKDEICVLVTGCMEDLFKHVFTQAVPETETKKAKKVLKADKVEDPASCENIEDLRNCTTGVLNQFCKDHGLKVGGTKKELMDRVWRHIQGESSDEDKSSRNKPKTAKKVPEKHACCGTNIAGAACGSSGTEEFGGHFFCWRHIEDAQKFVDAIDKQAPKTKEDAPEPVAKKTKASKAPKPETDPKKSKGKGPAKKEQELVTEGSEPDDE